MVGEIFLGTNDACDTSESVIDVFRGSSKSRDSSDSSNSSDSGDSSKSSNSSRSSDSSESSESSESSKASASVGRLLSFCLQNYSCFLGPGSLKNSSSSSPVIINFDNIRGGADERI